MVGSCIGGSRAVVAGSIRTQHRSIHVWNSTSALIIPSGAVRSRSLFRPQNTGSMDPLRCRTASRKHRGLVALSYGPIPTGDSHYSKRWGGSQVCLFQMRRTHRVSSACPMRSSLLLVVFRANLRGTLPVAPGSLFRCELAQFVGETVRTA